MKTLKLHSNIIASSICTVAFALVLYVIYNVAMELGQILINTSASL